MRFISMKVDISLCRIDRAEIIEICCDCTICIAPSLLPLYFLLRQMKKIASLIKAVLRFRQHYFLNPVMKHGLARFTKLTSKGNNSFIFVRFISSGGAYAFIYFEHLERMEFYYVISPFFAAFVG